MPGSMIQRPLFTRQTGLLSGWLLAFSSVGPGIASDSHEPRLTLDRIFATTEFDGDDAPRILWNEHGPGFHTLDDPEGPSGGQQLVRNDPATGDKEIILPAHAFVPPGASEPLGIDGWKFSRDGSQLLLFTDSRRVWRDHTRGDYWVLDVTTRELRKLGGDAAPSTLMFATFAPDGKRVAYVRENNLYVQELRTLAITALTTEGSAKLINGTFDWVYEEELGLQNGFRWSPDGGAIAYWQIDASQVREFILLNNTDSFYPQPEIIPYPKTGEVNPAARIGVVPAAGGNTRWMSLPGDPRNHYLAGMDWASNSTELILQQFNRRQNTNAVYLADASTGEARKILTETDEAWVENANPIHWIEGGKSFVWLSERDGWRQAYRVSRDGKRIDKITQDDFDVVQLQLIDEDGGWLYYQASPDNPTQRYLYRAPLAGGRGRRLTPADQPGTHDYLLSPDGQWAIHTYSSFRHPPVRTLIALPEHTPARTLQENQELRRKVDGLAQPEIDLFRIAIEPDLALDGWSLKPPLFDAQESYPVLFFVYGEPAGQTVLDRWGGKRQLWHWMLAQQGYVIMSVDNRGTPAARGRSWRKALYRQIGTVNVADQAAAVRTLLRERPYLDPTRVGVWGWSGGGSSTLNALFQHPDLYRMGMSIAPVANQRYYDTIYQERYMGLPEDNVEGYRLGSPITHARHLKGDLLLVHGTGDDNVHYQGTEALINELVAWQKQFTMMAYPNRRHGISEGKHTTLHLYTLLTRFLEQHLPPNPSPATPPGPAPEEADPAP